MKGRIVGAGVWVCLLAVVVAATDAGAPAPMARLEVAAQFEGGCLYRAGDIRVVELTGSYRQMGRQYGALLQAEMAALYETAIEGYYLQTAGYAPERLDTVARSLFDRYPRRYQEILLGMAETSGLDLNRQLRLNALEWYPKISHLHYGRCSGVAAWGSSTGRRPLVFGRNNDDSAYFSTFARVLVVAVFKPGDGSIPVALINYAGVIYAATGINRDGLFLELNSGPWMGFSLGRASVFTTLFGILQDYPSLKAAQQALLATLPDLCSIVNAADPTGAGSYEMSLYDSRPRGGNEFEFLAATNHFVGPTWPLSQVDEQIVSETSQRRYDNLVRLGRLHRGRFTPEVMMQVLDTTIPYGGPTEVDTTIYQVVAEPASLRIWLKVPRIQDWTGLDLAPLLREE